MKTLQDMNERDLRWYMNSLAEATEQLMPAADNERGRCCFLLLLFDHPEGNVHFVSNCARNMMVQALREAADRLERRDDTSRN